MRLKAHLIAERAWSQYLEVGIGPDAEIFTKTAPMAAVGTGSEIGIRATRRGTIPSRARGRGQQQRCDRRRHARQRRQSARPRGGSALLLGKAKDNNASCAIGPFLRLLDDSFGLAQVRRATIGLRVEGADGFTLRAPAR